MKIVICMTIMKISLILILFLSSEIYATKNKISVNNLKVNLYL